MSNKNKEEKTKEEYKVKYFFNEKGKTNLNEAFKKAFLLSLNIDAKKI